MSSPRVSIGLPVYNGASYLGDALDALCGQTMKDLEIIITDNASSDRTESICRHYAASDSRIRYFRHPRNLGAAANYNHVARLARGTYFKWASHDDTCDPCLIERCTQVLDSDPTVVASYSWVGVIDADNTCVTVQRNRLPTDAPSPHVRFRSLVTADYKRHPCTPVFGLIRRDALMQTTLIPPYVHGDRILLAQLCLLGRFVEIPDVLFYKREHPDRHGYRTDRQGLVARVVGTGPKPRVEWYDPAKKGSIVFPDWRRLAEYAASVQQAPLHWRERLACMLPLVYWPFLHAPLLARDLILAAHQAVQTRRLLSTS